MADMFSKPRAVIAGVTTWALLPMPIRIGPTSSPFAFILRMLRVAAAASVQSSSRLAFDDWLHAMLDDHGDRTVNPAFWFRHRHDQLVIHGEQTWLIGLGLMIGIGIIVGVLPALRAQRRKIVDALAGR